MTFPWQTRKQRRREEAAAERLAALQGDREAAYADTMAAHRRGNARGYHAALQRLVTATHAVMREEQRG